jgi:hypothetical protein
MMSSQVLETEHDSIMRILETEIQRVFIVALERNGHALELPSACPARGTKIQSDLAQ